MRLGLAESEFWDMTLGEVARWIKATQQRQLDKRREQAYMDYTQAMVIGSFVSSMFSNKDKPISFDEAYSRLLETQETREKAHTVSNASVARFLQFAQSHNKKYEVNTNGK